jgi:hypothetical protein
VLSEFAIRVPQKNSPACDGAGVCLCSAAMPDLDLGPEDYRTQGEPSPEPVPPPREDTYGKWILLFLVVLVIMWFKGGR